MNNSIKQNMHNELKLRYKEFFESKFAVAILKDDNHFTSVKKVSDEIYKLITTHKTIVLEEITLNPNIIKELRVPFFGSCYETTEKVTPSQVLEKICAILLDKKAEIAQIMQIHCIFVYRVYDKIKVHSEKKEYVKKIFPDSLFNRDIRSRIERKEQDVKTTTQLGISRHLVFTKMIGHSSKPHLSARDKFIPNMKSRFFQTCQEKIIPNVCGPSGHTGSLMLGIKLYGNLNKDEIQEYALTCFAFLAAGGNHSFQETMVVAQTMGINFKENDYLSAIPDSFKETTAFKNLSERFPEFLDFAPRLS